MTVAALSTKIPEYACAAHTQALLRHTSVQIKAKLKIWTQNTEGTVCFIFGLSLKGTLRKIKLRLS